MTTPNDNPTPEHEQNRSVLDNLREPVQAWLSAGSRLGDVVSDFAGRFREDREKSEFSSGAHAQPNPVAAEDSTTGRFKAAAQEAREGLSAAKSTEDYKRVSAVSAGHAEEIIRDLAGSARRAADQTKESDSAEEARTAFDRAVAAVRETLDETVEQARAGRAASGYEQHEQTLIDELRATVSREISPIAKPRDITIVPELPKTRSGKIMRRLLKDMAEGRDGGDTSTLSDPTIMEQIRAKGTRG